MSLKLDCNSVEIGMEDDHTVVLRMRFTGYSAMELHDSIVEHDGPLNISFRRRPMPVSMETPRHPIESFPCELPGHDVSLEFCWRIAAFMLWCFLLAGAI